MNWVLELFYKIKLQHLSLYWTHVHRKTNQAGFSTVQAMQLQGTLHLGVPYNLHLQLDYGAADTPLLHIPTVLYYE